jgi:DNA-binding MarR family transcriptional regulator
MDNFNINDSLGYLIGQTNSLMRHQFNKMIKEKGFNTSVEQWGILNIVNAFPGITQSEIALKGRKDKTNITRMLDLLEKNGNIERKSSKRDRRQYNIYITDNGIKLLNAIVPISDEVNQQATKGINKEELVKINSLLKEIQTKLL